MTPELEKARELFEDLTDTPVYQAAAIACLRLSQRIDMLEERLERLENKRYLTDKPFEKDVK